jgi:hypothetical protein
MSDLSIATSRAVIDYVISGRTENLKRLLIDLSFSQAGRAVLKNALRQAEGRKVAKRRLAYLDRLANA